MADVKKIEQDIRDKAGEIAKVVAKGQDIVITKTSTGIVIKKMTVQKV